MPRNSKNLKMLMNDRITSLTRFGESKHQAKQIAKAEAISRGERWNPSKVEGIYSIKTTEAYRQTANEFANWMKTNNQKVYSLDSVSRETIKQYLQERQDRGLSAWTISKDLSALNKVFGYGITKQEAELHTRSLKDITRSREIVSSDNRDFSKYREQMTMAEATGMRRQSVCAVCPENFHRDENGLVSGVELIEKGGKFRIAPVLEAYKEELTAIVDSKPIGEPMFSEYDIHIDNHSFRSEYATNLYNQLLQERLEEGIPVGGIYGNADSQELTYRGYDKATIQEVSEALGHHRLDVVVMHYLR